MSWQHGGNGRSPAIGEAARPGAADHGTLASDADRDSAVRLLSEAFAEGRLTAGEHGDRVQAAYGARTWARLSELTSDLPAQSGAADEQPTMSSVPDGTDRCLLCALLILCPPAGVAWLLASRRRARGTLDRRGAVWPVSVPAGNGQRAEDR
jgi:hypothetical protein